MTTQTANHIWLMPILRMTAALTLSAGLLAASGLTITSPVSGSTANPGQKLAVTVAATGTFTQLVVAGQYPIGFSPVLTGAASQFTLPIPAQTPPGVYSLTALGVTSGGSVSSAPITISVERADAPVEIHVTPETLSLPVGERMALRVVGTYADATKLDITHSAFTSFSSNSTGVASVDTQGNVTAVSPGLARILINNSLSIPVEVPQTFSVTPDWPFLYASQSTQFSAFQPGTADVPVSWTISPQVGSINGAGVYTAPRQITAWQGITITATMKSNPAKSVSTGVTLLPPMTIGIVPSGPVTLPAGLTQRFGANVQNTVDNGVTWSISPAKGAGTIDQTGLYTAPATVTAQQTVKVTVTSIPYPNMTATATITLVP
jgi:hypothetical protein